jgi:type I restriction enzyme R subunit
MLEDIRRRLRDLVKFIDKKQRKLIYTDFEDQLGPILVGGYSAPPSAVNIVQYRKKVLSFLKEHENHIALQKLKRNIPITTSDISELERILFESGAVGTKEVFEKAYGKQAQLGLFIRKMIGLDRQAAKRAFRDYLDDKTLTANQIRFIDLVVDYLTRNGVMEADLLYEPPFTDYSTTGLDGVFDSRRAEGIVDILNSIRQSAVA